MTVRVSLWRRGVVEACIGDRACVVKAIGDDFNHWIVDGVVGACIEDMARG